MTETDPGLRSMDPNRIISNLDLLLEAGIKIDDIVSNLGPMYLIANYNKLVDKGATNIDLAQLVSLVDPVIVSNNLETFYNAGVPLDYASYVFAPYNNEAFYYYDLNKLMAVGVHPQLIADKIMSYDEVDLAVLDTIPEFIRLGINIDGSMLIDKLLKDSFTAENISEEVDVPIVMLTHPNDESISKLLNFLSDDSDHGPSTKYPERLVRDGTQTDKIFFSPIIQVIANNTIRHLQNNWNGRILPGQTLKEGIANELKEVYGYSGAFIYYGVYLLDDKAKDKSGQDIERYSIQINLLPLEGDETFKIID